jgi:hypothetical protein
VTNVTNVTTGTPAAAAPSEDSFLRRMSEDVTIVAIVLGTVIGGLAFIGLALLAVYWTMRVRRQEISKDSD